MYRRFIQVIDVIAKNTNGGEGAARAATVSEFAKEEPAHAPRGGWIDRRKILPVLKQPDVRRRAAALPPEYSPRPTARRDCGVPKSRLRCAEVKSRLMH